MRDWKGANPNKQTQFDSAKKGIACLNVMWDKERRNEGEETNGRARKEKKGEKH